MRIFPAVAINKATAQPAITEVVCVTDAPSVGKIFLSIPSPRYARSVREGSSVGSTIPEKETLLTNGMTKMIYGLNFNKTQIPEHVAKKFAHRLDKSHRRVKDDRSCEWRLQGVCDKFKEMDYMVAQADNGRRKFHWATRRIGTVRSTTSTLWYGLYIGYKGGL